METREQRWRREGRREAAIILMQKLSEDQIDDNDLTIWNEDGSESCGWNEDAVFEMLDAQTTDSYLERKIKRYISNNQNEVMDAKQIEYLLGKVIEENEKLLTGTLSTALDRAARYLGIDVKK